MNSSVDVDIVKCKNFFSKFKDKPFRRYQKETIYNILKAETKIVAVNAPTGAGKSLVAAVLSHIYGNAIYLTQSKVLQDQLVRDFPEFEVLKGRSNYPCALNPELTRVDCPHIKPKNCSAYAECPYGVQKMCVIMHPLRILNYAYYISEANYIGAFSDKNIIIADEADTLEKDLSDFIGVSVSERLLDKFNLLHNIKRIGDVLEDSGAWLPLLQLLQTKLTIHVRTMNENIERALTGSGIGAYGNSTVLLSMVKERNSLENLLSKLSIMLSNWDLSWIVSERANRNVNASKSWDFSPLWLSPELSNKYFFSHAKKFVLMSATFPPIKVLAKTLGVKQSDITMIEVPPTFSPRNKPIHVENAANMGYATFVRETPKLLSRINEIVNKYPNDKGIIHCSSYRVRDVVMQLNNKRFITHNTADRDGKLNYFIQSEEPLVMVSPSMERGVSLDDDLSRFLIVAKAPYYSVKDKKVALRKTTKNIGQEWYSSVTAQTIEQMVGRGVRSVNDYCDVYLLDTCIGNLIKRSPQLFSKHFKDCLV